MKQILIIGIHGQLGQQLQQSFGDYKNVVGVGRETVDLTQPDQIRQIMAKIKPSLVINTAAYTAVDRAESEPEIANAINAIAPGILAAEAERLGAMLMHISTDYVFDGDQSHPYSENDSTNPLNVYGHSKLAGEQAIQKNCNLHIILRTAWVYGVGGKSNFVKTMLKLGTEREEVRVVADQVGSPTWTGHLAQTILQLSHQFSLELAGTFHYTNSGVASWYDFAVAIFEEAKLLGFPLKVQRIIPITTAQYPTPAQRPTYSVLSTNKLSRILNSYPPHWRQGLRQMLHALKFEQVIS